MKNCIMTKNNLLFLFALVSYSYAYSSQQKTTEYTKYLTARLTEIVEQAEKSEAQAIIKKADHDFFYYLIEKLNIKEKTSGYTIAKK